MQNTKSIIDALTKYQPHLMNETKPSAAVMVILLIDEYENIDIILTKRTATLTYAGDYSFPGGMRGSEDKNLYATAMREIKEELNLPDNSYQLIGQLDDFKDRFGHLVRPFITMMQKNDFEKLYQLSTAEISNIYHFPLNKLDEIADNPFLYDITKRHPCYSFSEGDVFIWGLTASILVHVLNIITGVNKPLGKEIALGD